MRYPRRLLGRHDAFMRHHATLMRHLCATFAPLLRHPCAAGMRAGRPKEPENPRRCGCERMPNGRMNPRPAPIRAGSAIMTKSAPQPPVVPCEPTPPPPPGPGWRRHGFPRSHGPAEGNVKRQWLTLRCGALMARPAPPQPCRPCQALPNDRRNPRPAPIHAKSAIMSGPAPQPPLLRARTNVERPNEPERRRNPCQIRDHDEISAAAKNPSTAGRSDCDRNAGRTQDPQKCCKI
jgi:hypothetical protein